MKVKNLFKENGIFSGKSMLALVIAAAFFSGTALGAVANESTYEWKSLGNVEYKQGDNVITVFNKEDLKYLDDKIGDAIAAADSAKTTAETEKKEIAKKLNTWSIPTKLSEVNPTYDEIKTTLGYIKSTPGVGTAYKDGGNNQYYVKPNGGLTTVSGEADTSKPNSGALSISAATAGNLSAGTAAWVNGEFIIGTGADNNNYYALGVSEGLTKTHVTYEYHNHVGSSSNGSGCYTKPVYHVHKGNSTQAGGCYVAETYTYYYSCPKTNQCVDYNRTGASGIDTCPYCGGETRVVTHSGVSNGGDKSDSYCKGSKNGNRTGTRYVLNCGKTTTTIESYALGCGKTEETIEKAIISYY